ncbi:MAG: hypothetical protein JWQ84_1607 [Mucilaginibacter sp.]|nr:hypothetical protein [Mucilaginibacter sp.]
MTLRDVRRVDLNLNDANPRIVNFTTGYGKKIMLEDIKRL